MATIKRDTGKAIDNLIIGLSVVGMMVGAYFLFVKKTSATTTTTIKTDPVHSAPNENPNPPAACAASYSEFPLPFQAGFSSRSNIKCERQYIQQVQTYLNLFSDSLGYNKLTVDGQFGSKSLAAFQAFTGTSSNEIPYATYMNIVTALKAFQTQ